MVSAMDFFGEALYAYSQGDRCHFYLVFDDGRKFKLDLGTYFRKEKKLSRLEKKLVALCYGDILDVGCATGYYLPLLSKCGMVEGIDVSRKAIQVAREKGIKNCNVADVFSFAPRKKYDSIVLLQNGLGMSGSISRLKLLLKKLSGILASGGQLLVEHRRIKRGFEESTRFFEWKNKKSKEFKWANCSLAFLKKLCLAVGLKAEVVSQDRTYFLVRLAKISSECYSRELISHPFAYLSSVKLKTKKSATELCQDVEKTFS